MAVTVTYSLTTDDKSSDGYYEAIADLADRWEGHARAYAFEGIEAYRHYRLTNNQTDRSFSECAFELLCIGVLLRGHGEEAARMPRWAKDVLNRLIDVQIRHPWTERAIKRARGILHEIARHFGSADADDVSLLPLVEWLFANGESSQAKRLCEWSEYLATLDPAEARRMLLLALDLAVEFGIMSAVTLDRFTDRVDEFVARQDDESRWRYDRELRRRTRLEYHLGMLGTEVLSRAYRARFSATGRRIVILPSCMRARGEECKAEETTLGSKCQSCTLGCRVGEITRMGEKLGFATFILPDQRRGYGTRVCAQLKDVGVVGVACALTAWDVGWDLSSAGVPCQGVLLDHAGCRNHWHNDGIVTDVNLARLAAAATLVDASVAPGRRRVAERGSASAA